MVLLLLLTVILSNMAAYSAPTAKLHKNQVLTYNLTTEPEILDPARSTGVPEAKVEYSCFEGLARLGPNNVAVPGAAEKWTVSPDGKTYTFYLRKQAKWSNGEPVTAHDFEFAWKRTLNPQTASEYAGNLYAILNAEEYNTGKISDAMKVGVNAKDVYTLTVTLKAPCSYFPVLTTHHSLYPVHRKTVMSAPDKWAADPKTYIGNGPFKLVNWVHHERLEFVPNPYYWNRSKVKLTKLIFYTIEESSTALTMFESSQLDFVDELPNPELPRLQKAGILIQFPYLGTYYYMFNTKKPPLNDVRVRKALTLAIDRAKLVKYITKGGEKSALAYVPLGIPDSKPGKMFRQVGGTFFKDSDIKQAKKLLAEAGFGDIKKFPTLEILYNTLESHKQIAEAIQEMWSKQLGIKVTLTNQEWKVYLQSRDQGNYQIARAGWIADYIDPMTFMDMWMTDNGNNDTGWSNSRYDTLIRQAQQTGDPQARMKILHDAEMILMNELPIAPIYFYTRPSVMQKWVKGIFYSSTSMIDFSGAYILKH